MPDTPIEEPPRTGAPVKDPWARLRATTSARIGLGRVGDAMRTTDVLAFQLAHGRARDAVHTPIDIEAIASALPAPPIIVKSQAPDRATYLRRPDLGRRLDPACRGLLEPGGYDAVFVIADGLSASGVQLHAVPFLTACMERLKSWNVAPVVIATQARVALGDEIAAGLGARICAMLIGERPGLSVADSLGVYLTYDPKVGRRDSERNCISNIHPAGLRYEQAAEKLVWLMTEARNRKLTGVNLKDDVAGLPRDVRVKIEHQG
jgi:ethanolamine ammonia-lyase small subunit